MGCLGLKQEGQVSFFLYLTKQLHLIDYDEDTNEITTHVWKHAFGEITQLLSLDDTVVALCQKGNPI